jgi:hypothetical protein
MKKFLKIQSKGEIEIEAFTLIGASSKRNDSSKIGYYGSGLKYSIAAMLRNNIEFKVFNGSKEIVFSILNKTFRGDNYENILVDGKETSMTTTMGGRDWDIPFAPFREIYSNALDEDEDVILSETDNLIGQEGTTTFYIEKTQAMGEFYNNINEYFCSKNPSVLASNEYISIYPPSNNGKIKLFRKGILCYEDKLLPSVYTYNSKYFTINESRVCDNLYMAQYHVSKGLKSVEDGRLIKHLITTLAGGNAGFYEHQIDFDNLVAFSNTWFDVCKNYTFVPAEVVMFCSSSDLEGRLILPKALLIPLYKQFPELDVHGLSENSDCTYIEELNPSKRLVDKVIDALSILNTTIYKTRLKDYKIMYVNFLKRRVLAEAKDSTILLSTKLESEDVSFIAKVIIEENEHLITNLSDESRDFQDHLIKLLYDALTEKK